MPTLLEAVQAAGSARFGGFGGGAVGAEVDAVAVRSRFVEDSEGWVARVDAGTRCVVCDPGFRERVPAACGGFQMIVVAAGELGVCVEIAWAGPTAFDIAVGYARGCACDRDGVEVDDAVGNRRFAACNACFSIVGDCAVGERRSGGLAGSSAFSRDDRDAIGLVVGDDAAGNARTGAVAQFESGAGDADDAAAGDGWVCAGA